MSERTNGLKSPNGKKSFNSRQIAYNSTLKWRFKVSLKSKKWNFVRIKQEERSCVGIQYSCHENTDHALKQSHFKHVSEHSLFEIVLMFFSLSKRSLRFYPGQEFSRLKKSFRIVNFHLFSRKYRM